MTPEIVQNGAPVLRKKAEEVPLSEITGPKIKKILKDMASALFTQDDGVALAAPQIGVSLRIFVVAKVVLSPLRKGALPSPACAEASAGRSAGGLLQPPPPKTEAPPLLRGITPASEDGGTPFTKGEKQEAGYLTFINPVITKLSRDKAVLDEGCLSVRPLYGKIKRSRKATIQAYDENGKFFERGASGLLAQIFQHETDHLEGVLFIDKATNLKELPITHDSSLMNN